MKRIFLTSLLLIVLLFSFTGCSDNETTKVSDSDEEEIISEELQIDGTGKINLKELVESPKLALKPFSELTTKDLKSFYNADENDNYGTKTINGIEFDTHFSNDGYTTTTKDGVSISTKNEYFTISNRSNFSISMFSKDILVDEEFPEELEVRTLEFSAILQSDMTTEEQLEDMYNDIEYLFPYIKENNCKSVEDFAIALGFEETDKSMLYAIKNNVEYYADYESDYGALSVAYFPDGDMGAQTLSFSFEDETSWLKSIDISSSTGMNGDEEIKELQVYFRKNLD